MQKQAELAALKVRAPKTLDKSTWSEKRGILLS
jgi:hypothetical protein